MPELSWMGRHYSNVMLWWHGCMYFTQDLAYILASQRRILPAYFLYGGSQKTNGRTEACCPSPRLILHPCGCPVLFSTTQLQKLHVWNLKLLGKPFLPSSVSIWGRKVCSLPPPQNISNFHLSSLRITRLTGAGVQAVLICPFARTLCKQSVSYLLCEEGKKNDLIALAGHVIGHPFILLTINYICNQRDSTFSTSKMLLSKAIGMLSVHHICPQSMNF